MSIPTRPIRQFITKYFNADELEAFLLDYFPPVYDDLGTGLSKQQQINLLIKYCYHQDMLAKLLGDLQQERPKPFTQSPLTTPSPNPQSTNPPAPTLRNPNQIFISHASQDTDVAHRLATDLRAAGFAVWMAPDSIRPGEKWVEAIGRGLEESGKFLLLISPEAANSYWVKRETNTAMMLESHGQMSLYPLLLRQTQLPALWLGFQHLPLGNDYGQAVERLLTALGHHRPTPPIIQPPPPKLPNPPIPNQPTAEPDTFTHPITGKEMVKVPAGTFLYGKDLEEMKLDTFWIDKTPVTHAEYKRFIDANPSHEVPSGRSPKYSWDKQRRTYPSGMADHPVVYVSWRDALAYAKWAGGKLPTEQQWEKAARGTKGWRYPWGNEWEAKRCNTSESGIGGTSPVGQFSPQGDSSYGCVDMSGNAWEWTASQDVARGGSCYYDRVTARVDFFNNFSPRSRNYFFGFRVVSSVASGF